MDVGVHLPLADIGEWTPDAAGLRTYAATARDLGFGTLAANDHLVWQRPWLDGPTVLAHVLEDAGSMTLATSITLPVVRHPVVVAKWLTTLGCLSGRRIVAGLGPGSSRADYDAVGIAFDERWARFDEALPAVKALVRGERPRVGNYYDFDEIRLAPLPVRVPEIWAASWGSDARLRAMARVADGWLASGYNTTPRRFGESRARLDGHLEAVGRAPSTFPDSIATMWLHITEDRDEADQLLRGFLAPLLRRDVDELSECLPIGPRGHCIDLLNAYRSAGAQQILLWPVKDPIGQLHVFAGRVRAELGS